MTTDNPLKQYFRRPALYLKLPSGGGSYGPDTIDMPDNQELPIYPMTAIDEITTRTPDALFNGIAVTEILKSCVPNIKDPWKILNVDLDPILVAIKIATNGSTMELSTRCPACEETSKYDINLTGLLASFKPGDYNQPLMIDDLAIKFKPLTYKQMNAAGEDQFEIQRQLLAINQMEDGDEKNQKSTDLLKHINSISMNIIVETIEYIKAPSVMVLEKEFIREFLLNCNKNTYNAIKDANIELRKSTELKPFDITCMNCNHEYQQPFNINVSDFFD